MLDVVPDAIYLIKKNGVILDLNETAARAFGRSPESMKGLCLWECYPDSQIKA